jgi:succinate dehydrogenase / fumarate reductase flavoprotein subunit
MGGIEVDSQLRVSTLEGCYAVGECANAKVHGANRLGGNSLLEITTFGAIAAQNAVHYASQTQVHEADDAQLNQDRRTLEALFNQEHNINFYEQRELLGKLLYENVGIIRDNTKLTEAMQALRIMQSQTTQMGLADKNPANNTHLIDFLEFKNAMMLAALIIKAALQRDESRGAHFKIGFESANDGVFKHSITLSKETEV